MKLITEYTETDVQCIVEANDKGEKSYVIEGIFAMADSKNRNGRIYPKSIMENAVAKYVTEQVKTKRAVGELNHPDGPTVNLDRVSHKIVSLQREGNNFIGKAQILSTPMGKIVESLLKDGVCLGVSSRGIGSVRQNPAGYMEVGEDFMLATAADIVADPSAPDVFVQGIMEGKEWIWDGGMLREKMAEQTQRRINTLVDEKLLEEYKLSLFNEFLNSL